MESCCLQSASISGNIVTFPVHKAMNHVYFLNAFSFCGIFSIFPVITHDSASACIIGAGAADGETSGGASACTDDLSSFVGVLHYLLLAHSFPSDALMSICCGTTEWTDGRTR